MEDFLIILISSRPAGWQWSSLHPLPLEFPLLVNFSSFVFVGMRIWEMHWKLRWGWWRRRRKRRIKIKRRRSKKKKNEDLREGSWPVKDLRPSLASLVLGLDRLGAVTKHRPFFCSNRRSLDPSTSRPVDLDLIFDRQKDY